MANIWRYLDAGYKAGYKADIIFVEGSMIDTTASSYDLNQLIQELPHIFNLSSSCTDLIFTSQRNLVMESGIHSLLHWRFHYQIVFAKLNLSIFCSPSYERTVCYSERSNAKLIRMAIDQLYRLRALSNKLFHQDAAQHNAKPHSTWKNLAFKSYCCFNKNMFLFKYLTQVLDLCCFYFQFIPLDFGSVVVV